MYETLNVVRNDNGVVTVSLNRPEKRNALSTEMIAELTHMAGTIGQDPSTRVVVLTGEGEVFCAGGDLTWMQAQIEADRATRMVEARKIAEMLRACNTMKAPMIARIAGNAFGGGLGLMCVCDVVIAAEGTTFGLTETKLGLIPATIGPYVIARMGEGVARRVFMSSRIFGAAEAVEFGVVSRVVPRAELDAEIARECAPYLKVSGAAVGAAKSLARYLGPQIDDAVIDETIKRLADTWETDDAKEGIAAFLEKRKPRWAE